jgi:SAM-dependent methyltransferase
MDIDAWLAALEARHLANLTRPELTRALRALSSCYVERRDKLSSGAALDGAGKRAAFALFYGPLHFLTLRHVLRALEWEGRTLTRIHDLGCGTGVGGAAWALAAGAGARVAGIDRNAWAVAEANWTYRQLGVAGSARIGDAVREFPQGPGGAIVLAYTANELPDAARDSLLERLTAATSPLLIVEPIAKKDRGWWPRWAARLAGAGVAEHEWRFPADLPPLLRQIAKSAGLDPRELTARSLSRI